MIPELGTFSLILALLCAIVQGTFPLLGAHRNHGHWMNLARSAAWSQLVFVGLAYACLTVSFLSHDFSVRYVALNSNTQLPVIYLISGVWAGHEGSLLLWALILAGWTGAVERYSSAIPQEMLARVIAVMGLVSTGFLLFIIMTSSPFARQFPIPLEGNDLNPLLQDPGLAIHPPILYLGYVGFSVPFAFGIAALLAGRLDGAWARWSRPWTLFAWSFLTIGIALGSWWAYNELGWGGWWFWDPVENASFMPWLVGTALVHSLAATEKRGVFKAWTVLLALVAFSLSLLGTFLVRSGILTSVHAFANDPARGVFILIFLSLVVGLSLGLYAWRAPSVRSTLVTSPISRESLILINNILLMVTTATILLGTLYPLVMDALGLGKISVGAPYFNSVFVPLTVPLVLLLGTASVIRWKQDKLKRLLWILTPILLISFVIGVLWPVFNMPHYSSVAILGVTLGVWTFATAVVGVWSRTSGGNRWRRLRNTPSSFYGMTLAHVGVGVFAIGIALTSAFSVEKQVRMAPGDHQLIGGYDFRFDGVIDVRGPNYLAQRGLITVLKDGLPVSRLEPEKRTYQIQKNPMTEAGIEAGLMRDLYVSLGEPLDDGRSWGLRLYFKPFIRWIWLGALLIAFGGLIAAFDRRYRSQSGIRNHPPSAATTPSVGI